jgi:hypothetical protein
MVTQLSQNRGQAMGVNVFTLFVGFGVGSLVFQALLLVSFTTALVTFGLVAAMAAVLALRTFAAETAGSNCATQCIDGLRRRTGSPTGDERR